MIRKATAQDAPAIAELTYLIWRDMELEIVRRYEKETVIAALVKSTTEVHYRNHIENVDIYEVDGQVAGILIAYPGQYEAEYEQAWQNLMLDADIQLETGTPLPVLEAERGDVYIETIATFPEFRGRGIATKLIQARLQSNPKATWSLNCDEHNERAYQLYRKLGFRETMKKLLYGHEYRYMIYQNEGNDHA
ncbi:GNAT family N-acetyltransferase [Staphylococcus intermedius]|uniref:GNAT family acetyltransferase n=1 Tax=Staphylococcus intermedius NCTC 11048 TaxID=1141106 RepID=A0A380GAE9_STAIN|nr:GNAT family N-acetyltransferase [Staphylococcus intermedius]PCF65284.1 GNAT family N-acetyltransferase [Staphylococcus intermedius]PCF80895.1 GNAT family N-acetyltransferase [Staphylococcus intermedius]PCF82244.1 GNAT family N-acetyltransferase [Staphylococcus intermedius]PCF87506.1 GNAT family N-acetyltransferase [Staphylococcus intermedius]PCF88580.1 GNAT family N-acetyltransferase [Staphylococcus intermedius]